MDRERIGGWRLKTGVCLVIVLALLGAVGANPRYLEELCVGGGYGSTGIDLESDGDLAMDGDLTVDGDVGGATATITGAVSGGSAAFGGGYGSTGIDLESDGDLAMDGDLTVDGDVGGATATITGDAAVNGGDITSTAGSLMLSPSGGDLKIDGSDGSIRNYRHSAGNTAWHAYMHDDGGNDTLFTSAYIVADDDTDGSEDGSFAFACVSAGTMQYSRFTINGAGNVEAAGDATISGGGLIAGSDGVTRGVLMLWDGGGGTAPGCLKMASPNGTVWYLFVEDDGTLKVHSSAPTQNSDGSAVGDQTD